MFFEEIFGCLKNLVGYWLKIEAEKEKMLISETETENNAHWFN